MIHKFKLSLMGCLFLSAVSYGTSVESVSAPVAVHHNKASLKSPRNTSSQDDEKSNYKGSQADNKTIKSLSESVNPATGALSISLPLLSVKGFIPLDVSVSFSAGSSGMLGLPNGWQFNIDYVVPGKSMTFNGKTYVIDFNWSDSTGYQSGLKYLNQHGVLFKDMLTDTPLPTSFADSRAYRYCLSMPDGSADYFDATGKLIAKGDRFGNHIRYDYNDPEMGVQHNYLKSITDSLGQVFNFGYSANELSISYIDSQNRSHTQSLAYNQNGILSYTDSLGFITQLNYQTRNGVPVVNQILYPNGLETDISYQDLHFKTPDNKIGALNAVATINHIDHANADQVLAEADYEFSQNNFTGYPNNYPLSDDKDSLMESNNPDYRYTVTVKVNEHSKTASNSMDIRKTQTIYNAMSEPVEQDVYLAGENTPTYRTKNKYQLINNKHLRTVNYNKPIEETSAIYDAATQGYITLGKSDYTYDAYGNTLTTDTYKYNPLTQKLVESTKSINSYDQSFNQPLTNINMAWNPLTNTFDTKSVENTLSNDHKNVLQSTLYDGDINATNAWKSTDYSYDSHGLVIQSTVKWSQAGHTGVQSSTVKDSFSYDLSKRLETLTHTDALGSVTTQVIDSITGDLLSKCSALGNTITSSYDLDGRVLKKTLPAGQSITYQYEDYQKDKQNAVTEISPLGAKTTTQYDASNHKIATYSNTDPNNINDMVLQEADRYNSYGELVQKKDALGNVTSYSYNALSLPTAQTDSDGNVTTMQYDLAHLSQTSFVNGIKTKTVIYNPDKKPLKTISYPNSHNPLQPHYHLEEISTLDGNNQVLETTHNKIDDSGAVTVLNTLTSSYTPDGKTQSQILQSGQSKETITAEYDLLDDVLDKTKTLDFSDITGSHHYITHRDHFNYDAAGELIAETNQAGQSITYSYDQDGNKITETRLDGTVVHFAYDKNDNLITKTYTDNSGKHSYNYSYDADGNKVFESLDGQGIKISYTLSGLQTAISYPDGKVATATYNKYGQLLSSTDVNAQQTTMTYLKDGKLNTVSNNQDKVTYLYSTQDKPNENNQYGALIAKDYQGIYTQQFTADAFGQEHELKQIDSLGTTLLDIVNTFDAKGMLTDVIATSDKAPNDPNVNYIKHYTYDDFNQLIKEESDSLQKQPITSTSFAYDGNGNILRKTKDGKITTYQYNNLDQLISYTEDGSTYTPKYNANGDEVDDGKGTSYQFNGISQLIGVQNQAMHLEYSYYANGLRSDRTGLDTNGISQDHYRYYYTGDTISAVNDLTHPDNVSFFLDGKNRIHAYSVS
ncbi:MULTISPECIES: RHS repeat protein [Cysteiniphilum]|uniref:Teneurin-like YD-shell domain-containing protein n=1 Tax=Cysteiniphilum litorale TaxID=2056700 RepID=A0A8J3E9A3_9GAMM|nr:MULTISPECIES: RHS repeat protein [Cysteiniphilum]GGF97807.1 hypothetical protein GCM10010995_13760 [Cysteiniphilum litorale]